MVRRYECPRCGHLSDRISSYRTHIARKKMCKASEQDLIPDMDNALIHMKNTHGEFIVLRNNMNSGRQPNSNTTTHCNTITTNNNSINIHVVAAAPKRIKHFPHQDLDHLTYEFKRALVDMARKADGFARAVKRMSDVTYFNTDQSHNMNVIIADAVAHVFGKNQQWNVVTTESAIKDMLDTQGDAIRNFPDDPGIDGTVPTHHVRAIDDAYNEGSFTDDPELVCALKVMAANSRAELEARFENLSHLAVGMASSKHALTNLCNQ